MALATHGPTLGPPLSSNHLLINFALLQQIKFKQQISVQNIKIDTILHILYVRVYELVKYDYGFEHLVILVLVDQRLILPLI